MSGFPASVAAPAAAPTGVTKKKFAAPPVKSACLACRAARTRCDGSKPCATCQSRNRDCVYTPSRRGGPRARKKPWAGLEGGLKELPDDVLAMLSQEAVDVPQQPIPLQDYVDPGAGLKHLDDRFQDSDFIFDSLFMNSSGPVDNSGHDSGLNADVYGTGTPALVVPMARSYPSEAAILDAYYVFIHPFFPILPPPYQVPVDQSIPYLQNNLGVFEEGFRPTSPISLAISAILALIPCPEDVNYQSHECQLFRRRYAQYLAQSAFETMEDDEDIPDSSIDPSKPLSEEHDHSFRSPFHPRLPVELESIVALNILSVYEYAQRGNLKKMQNRAGQALMTAMEMGLHSCDVEDAFSEARQRVWWMTYTCVAQGAIVNNTNPNFTVFSPTFKAKLPKVVADPEAFPAYIQAQQAILAATQFVIELKKALSKENADMNPIYKRMKELEAFMGPLLSQSEVWILPSTITSPVDPTEDVVARSLRAMASIKLNSARIKLHRYCAFFDTPVFTRKHCDLKSFNGADDGDEPRRWPTCSCSTYGKPFSLHAPDIHTTNTSTNAAGSSNSSTNGNPSGHQSPSSDGHGYPSTVGSASTPTPNATGTTTPQQQQSLSAAAASAAAASFPFTSHESAKICLRSALNIARNFNELPYPNPIGIPCEIQSPCLLSPTSTIVAPRTMPSFACCAMQCAYALLMVHQKTRNLYPCPGDGCGGGGGGSAGIAADGGGVGGDRPMVANSLLARLQQGLTSIYATLSNYATAFEALGGMRDQVRGTIEDSAGFTLPM